MKMCLILLEIKILFDMINFPLKLNTILEGRFPKFSSWDVWIKHISKGLNISCQCVNSSFEFRVEKKFHKMLPQITESWPEAHREKLHIRSGLVSKTASFLSYTVTMDDTCVHPNVLQKFLLYFFLGLTRQLIMIDFLNESRNITGNYYSTLQIILQEKKIIQKNCLNVFCLDNVTTHKSHVVMQTL